MRTCSVIVILVGVFLISSIASATKVTWVMGLCAFLFMVLGQVLVDESKTVPEANHRIGMLFAGAAVMAVTICLATQNWWLLLHYGLPALLGVVFPLTWFGLESYRKNVVAPSREP